MGTLQTTFRCWGEGEPSSEMSDDSDGDGEMSVVRVSRGNARNICGRTCLGEGRQLDHRPCVIAGLEEEGEGEQLVPPLGEVGAGGVVEPGGLVRLGEDGVHGWGGGEGGGGGGGTGSLYNWNPTHTDRGGPQISSPPPFSRGIKTPSG